MPPGELRPKSRRCQDLGTGDFLFLSDKNKKVGWPRGKAAVCGTVSVPYTRGFDPRPHHQKSTLKWRAIGGRNRLTGGRDMAKSQIYRPGQTGAPSGVYDTVGPRGGIRPDNEVSHTKGKPLPPTAQPGEGYRLQDAAKHKR